MTVSRVTHDNDYSDGDFRIAIAVIDQMTVETGRGPAYQKTVYHLRPDSDQRVTKNKTIVCPDDDSLSVDVPVTQRLTLATGRGPAYQKTQVRFVSFADDDRTVHVRRLPPRDAEGSPLEVEAIDVYPSQGGSGPAYQKEKFHLKNDD